MAIVLMIRSSLKVVFVFLDRRRTEKVPDQNLLDRQDLVHYR
jgi:hypothetical protein